MPPADDPLFDTTWVHAFEEDTAGRAVFRRDTDVPLSRRPRERVVLERGGSARMFAPGPDDRYIERAASWTAEGDDLLVRTPDRTLRIVERSPERLVVVRESQES